MKLVARPWWIAGLGLAVVAGALAMGTFRARTTWDLESVEPPWTDGVAIYEHITRHIAPGERGLTEGGERLPDEDDDAGLRWVAGGLDGAFAHHGGGGEASDQAARIHAALRAVVKDASTETVAALYALVLEGNVLEYVDPLLEGIVEAQDLDGARLTALATWLAERAPDREAVKLGIALFGILPDAGRQDLLRTLGRHEELTLYAAVALAGVAEDPDRTLHDLAQHVDGWGRIHLVERLAETTHPGIRQWLLREGYKNSVMYEYLAYTCATAGGLLDELSAETVDDELLAGAGDILRALIAGGPAEDIDDYADGAAVAQRYLHHLGPAPSDLEQLLAADAIARFVDDDQGDWTAREARGWTPAVRERLRAEVARIRALPHWPDAVHAGLAADDPAAFYSADEAARVLGIDTWDTHLARLESGADDGWYHVMQTDDPTRIDRAVALATERLPLADIAAGPAEELGFGPDWAPHSALDFILQELRRFPGKGWPLIEAGLQSPVIRNRHMALRALAPWPLADRPPAADPLLRRALTAEPHADVRTSITAVLAGEPLE